MSTTVLGTAVSSTWKAFLKYSVQETADKFIITLDDFGMYNYGSTYVYLSNSTTGSIGVTFTGIPASGLTSTIEKDTSLDSAPPFERSYCYDPRGRIDPPPELTALRGSSFTINKITSPQTFSFSFKITALKKWNKTKYSSGDITEISAGGTSTASVTLSIPAKNEFTITYRPGNYASGSEYTQTKQPGVSAKLRGSTYSRSGYTQTGWSTSPYGSTRDYSLSGSYSADADITLYPCWEEVPNTYAITYMPGNYASGSTYTDYKTEGQSRSLRGALYTRSGYTQIGWSTSPSGSTKAFDFYDSYYNDSSINLYPCWSTAAYTVSFNMNGHGTAPTPQTVEHNGTATEPEEPRARGYRFQGWYTNAACTNAFSFATPITKNTTLYAKWKKISAQVKHNGSWKVGDVKVKHNGVWENATSIFVKHNGVWKEAT